MEPVDRRAFLQRAGAAGAAAGGLWLAPSVLGSSTAFAVGSCIVNTSLDWDNLHGGSMGTPNTGATVNGFAVVPVVSGFGPYRINMSVVPVGTPGGGAGGVPNGISNTTVGAIPGSQYFMAMTNNAAAEGYSMTFTFRNSANTADISVYNLSFTITDIDQNGTAGSGYQDIVTLTPTPSSAVANTPANISGTNPYVGISGSNVAPADPYGNLTVTFAGPISTFTLAFTSGNRLNSVQAIGIADLSWCY